MQDSNPFFTHKRENAMQHHERILDKDQLNKKKTNVEFVVPFNSIYFHVVENDIVGFTEFF